MPQAPDSTSSPSKEPRLKRLREHIKHRHHEPVRFDITFHAPRWLVWSASAVMAAAALSYLMLDWPIAWVMHRLPEPIEIACEYVTEFGNSVRYLLGGGVLVIILILFKRFALASKFGLLVVSVAVSGILVNVLKVIFGRARPGAYWEHELYGFDPLSIGYDVNSFPSGHAATVGSVVMALILIWPKKWPWFAGAGAMVVSTRVLLESHYLSDVIVGCYLGILTTLAIRNYLWKPLGIWPKPSGQKDAAFVVPTGTTTRKPTTSPPEA